MESKCAPEGDARHRQKETGEPSRNQRRGERVKGPLYLKLTTMYAVVSEDNHNELWAIFDSKEKAQQRIDEGYFQRHMYEEDKKKKLIVIEHKKSK